MHSIVTKTTVTAIKFTDPGLYRMSYVKHSKRSDHLAMRIPAPFDANRQWWKKEPMVILE